MRISATAMMLTGPLLAALPTAAFVGSTVRRRASLRLFSSVVSVESGVSRLSTLQTLLNQHGAPGSRDCTTAEGDLVPADTDQNPNLHPHLFAIAKSQSTGNYICGLRRAYADDSEYESSTNAPWPIVESAEGSRGMNLLSLNSEHLMRRIAVEGDSQGNRELVEIYNDGLGQGKIDAAFDAPYESGSVEKLGYGCEKYVLLRVGPFPDLYESMAAGHKERGDESSSLIAAEASNGKFGGFGCTFAYYGRLLNSFGESRLEEGRDAARMCLRFPLPSIGYKDEDFKEVAVMGAVAEEDDSFEEALAKLQVFYEKMKDKEDSDPPGMGNNKTEEQMAIDEANTLLDRMALSDEVEWSKVRGDLADLYAKVGKEDMAAFVDPSRV